MDLASPSSSLLSSPSSPTERFSFNSTHSDCTYLQVEDQQNDEGEEKACEERKIISDFSKALKQKKFKELAQLLKKFKWLLNYKLEPTYSSTFLEPKTFKKRFSSTERRFILIACYENFSEDFSELLFFASALLEVEKLQEILKSEENIINQTRDYNTVLLFCLKLCSLGEKACVTCVKILVDHGVNINRCDPNGNTIFDLIVDLYKNQNSEGQQNLREIVHVLLAESIFSIGKNSTIDFLQKYLQIDQEQIKFCELDNETSIFNSIINNQKEETLKHKFHKSLINKVDKQENTLIQMIMTKFKNSDDALELIRYLLDRGANPNNTTKRNTLTPLELAALRNHENIFNLLINHKTTEISEKQFNNFIRWRAQIVKTKYVELLLESEKCDVNFKSAAQKNTPLHYSLIFNHEKAIQQQLKQGASLLELNSSRKCALDFIDAVNLEKYLDSCIVLDNYNSPRELRYKLSLNYSGLINKAHDRNEIEVLDKIRTNPRLEHLLTHPIIHLFLNLKWFKIRNYYLISVFLQSIVCILLYLGFYNYETNIGFWIAVATVSFNCTFKIMLFCVNHKFRILNLPRLLMAKKSRLHRIRRCVMNCISLHLFMELISLILMTLALFSSLYNALRPFVFVFVMINFLLTLGYHPYLSKWSAMLQKVFTTFTILSLYFFLPIFSFSLGFNTLFNKSYQQRRNSSDHHQLFENLSTSIFRTYIMITGEFNLDSSDFPNASAYFMFILFAISMTMILMNFWTGVAVSDIGNIEKDSEVNSFKNIVVFLKVVNWNVYGLRTCAYIFKSFGNPLLFSEADEALDLINNDNNNNNNITNNKKKQKGKSPPQFRIDFWLNRGEKLRRKDLPDYVDEIIVNKIKEFIRTKNETTVHDEMVQLNEKLIQVEKSNNKIENILHEEIVELNYKLNKIERLLEKFVNYNNTN